MGFTGFRVFLLKSVDDGRLCFYFILFILEFCLLVLVYLVYAIN